MATQAALTAEENQIEVDLREPWLALIFAWLWPGAGHFYQRRHAKGILFMVCIMGTYLLGLAMGDGRVVYVSDQTKTRRWHFLAQALVGAPAIVAVLQRIHMQDNPDEVLFGGLMTAPPEPPIPAQAPPQIDAPAWTPINYTYFEMGMLYTIVAGLLNVLAMYDAFAGPAYSVPEEKKKNDEEDEDQPPAESE